MGGRDAILYSFFVGLNYFVFINNNNWRGEKKEKKKPSLLPASDPQPAPLRVSSGTFQGLSENPQTNPHLSSFLFCFCFTNSIKGFPCGSVVKNLPAAAGDIRDLWVRETWQPVPVLLPGKFRRRRSLVGYSPRGCQASNTTEHGRTTYTAALCCFT